MGGGPSFRRSCTTAQCSLSAAYCKGVQPQPRGCNGLSPLKKVLRAPLGGDSAGQAPSPPRCGIHGSHISPARKLSTGENSGVLGLGGSVWALFWSLVCPVLTPCFGPVVAGLFWSHVDLFWPCVGRVLILFWPCFGHVFALLWP